MVRERERKIGGQIERKEIEEIKRGGQSKGQKGKGEK